MPFQGPESYGQSAVTTFKTRYGGWKHRHRALCGHMPPPYFVRREVHFPGSRNRQGDFFDRLSDCRPGVVQSSPMSRPDGDG